MKFEDYLIHLFDTHAQHESNKLKLVTETEDITISKIWEDFVNHRLLGEDSQLGVDLPHKYDRDPITRRIYKKWVEQNRASTAQSIGGFENLVVLCPRKSRSPLQDALVVDKNGGLSVNYPVFDFMHPEIPASLKKALPRYSIETIYNPYSDQPSLVLEDETGTGQWNDYTPPAWKSKPREKTPFPKVFKPLFYNLFPNKEHRDHVLDWMYTCLFVGKNETYLVLIGVPGCGKTMFASLMGSLVGQENYNSVPSEKWKSQFNSFIEGVQCIFVDEAEVGMGTHNALKRAANKLQAIERKGVDISLTVETHASTILATNYHSNIRIMWDDRRFTVPDLGKKPLIDILPESEVTEIVDAIKDTESSDIEALANYLYFWGKDRSISKNTIIRGETYWRTVWQHLFQWQRELIQHLIERQQAMSVGDMRKFLERNHKYRTTGDYKIKQFFETFRFWGRPLATVTKNMVKIEEWVYQDEIICEDYESGELSPEEESDIDFL